jgi:hypothetical protein
MPLPNPFSGEKKMHNLISSLDDSKACQILSQIARARAHVETKTFQLTPDLRAALASAFGVSAQPLSVSEGDIARQALLLLAEDVDTRRAIETMSTNLPETATQYDGGLTVAIGAAAFLVLQTYVHVERDKEGKWTVKLEKKPASEAILKALAAKIVAFVPKAP